MSTDNRKSIVAEAETLINEIYIETLRSVRQQVSEGNLSANYLNAVCKLLADQNANLESLRQSAHTAMDRVAEEADALDLDQYREDEQVDGSEKPFARMAGAVLE